MPVRIQEFEMLPGGTAAGEQGGGSGPSPEGGAPDLAPPSPQDVRDLIRRAMERVRRLGDR